MLAAQSLEGFSGLNLLADPDELGANGCVDGLDFDLSPGKVRSRSGYTKFTAAANTDRYNLLVGMPTGEQLVATTSDSATHKGVALNDSGAVVATSSALLGTSTGLPPRAAVAFGTPSASYVYLPQGTASNELARWDGTTWTYPSLGSDYASQYAAVQPVDNRLVLGYVYLNSAEVRFSDPGAPESFGANNYVDLLPGSGDEIRGVEAWGNSVYVFTRRHVHVFYGNSTDAANEPIFNYRTFDIPEIWMYQAVGALGKSTVAAENGVYYVATDGVYRTTGAEPVKVSTVLDPLFKGSAAPFFSGAQLTNPVIGAAQHRVYVSDTTASYTLVYDIPTEQWAVWSFPLNNIAAARTGGAFATDAVFFSYAEGTKDIGQLSTSATTDDGTPINATYRSALYDLGTPNDKVIHHSEVHGTGTVGFSVATNREAFPATRSLALGTAPTPSRAYDAFAPKPGEFNSYKLSSVDGAWEVDRITHFLRPSRATGLRAA